MTAASNGALEATQALFWRAMRSDVPSDILSVSFGGPRGSDGARGMRVYKEAFWVRQSEALRSDFAVTAELLGEREFRKMCIGYIKAFPSSHPALEWLGQNLVEFLRGSVWSPLASDVAALEWAEVESFLAADAAGTASLEGVAAERLSGARLCLVPSFRCVALETDALRLITAFRNGARGDELRALAQETQRSPSPANVVIARAGYGVRLYSVTAAQARALERAVKGAPFSEVVDALAIGLPGDGNDEADRVAVAKEIGQWFQRGWIERIES